MNNQNKRSLEEEEEESTVNKVARNEEEQEEEEQDEEQLAISDPLVMSDPIPTTRYKIPGYIITGTYILDTDKVPEDPLETEEYQFNIRNKNVTLHGAPPDSNTRYLLIGKTLPRLTRNGKFESKFTYFYPNRKKLKKISEKIDKELASSSSSSSTEKDTNKKYEDEDIAAINFLVRSMRNTSINDLDEQFENSTRLGGNKRKTRKNRKNRKSRKSRKNRKSRKH